MDTIEKPPVIVRRFSDLGKVKPKVRSVILQEPGGRPIHLLRRSASDNRLHGFCEPGTFVADDIFLPRSSAVIGKSIVTGGIRIGKNSRIVNGDLSGEGLVVRGAEITDFMGWGADRNVRMGNTKGGIKNYIG